MKALSVFTKLGSGTEKNFSILFPQKGKKSKKKKKSQDFLLFIFSKIGLLVRDYPCVFQTAGQQLGLGRWVSRRFLGCNFGGGS